LTTVVPNLSAVLCAFDLLELDGEDLRRLPIEVRKAGLAQLLRSRHPGIVLNEHYIGDGAIVYRQASSAAKASCRIDSARRTAPVAPGNGSRSRTRRRRLYRSRGCHGTKTRHRLLEL
jgi:hypothetical protein